MKKVITLLILMIPIVSNALEYQTDDINLKIDIPDEIMVFTKDNLDDNKDLEAIGLTKEQMIEIMDNNNIYLDAMADDLSWEFLAIIPNNTLNLNNLSHLPDKLVRETGQNLKTKFAADDFTIYQTKNNKFVIIDFYDKESAYYGLNYYTVANAKGYNFQMQKKKEISKEEKDLVKSIIDSVEIKVLDGYQNESEEIQKQIDEYSRPFNWKAVIIDVTVGGVVAIISTIIVRIKNRKRKEV